MRSLALLLIALPALAQVQVTGTSSGTLSARPVTCLAGWVYYATDQIYPNNAYYCNPSNTWNLLSASGGTTNLIGNPVNFSPFAASPTSTVDAAIQRALAGTFYFGNGTVGDHSANVFAGAFYGDGSHLTGLTGSFSAPQIGYTQGATGTIARTAQAALAERAWMVTDFGATNLADDTAAINAAISAAVNSSAPINRHVHFPAGTYCVSSPISIPVGMTGGEIDGEYRWGTRIYAAGTHGCPGSWTGGPNTSIFVTSGGVSELSIHDLTFDSGGTTNINPVVNLTTSPESSIRDHIKNVLISGYTSTGLIMDGCEDSSIETSTIIPNSGATGTTAVHWNAEFGNLHIYGSVWFDKMVTDYQSADIVGSTIGPIVPDGPASTLSLVDVYMYAGVVGSVNGDFVGNFGNITLNGSYIIGSTNSAGLSSPVAFSGAFSGVVRATGTYFDSGTSTGYVLFNGTTTALSGFSPAFIFTGTQPVNSTTVGTPGANVYYANQNEPTSWLAYSMFPTVTAAAYNGSTILHSYPVRVTGISAVSSGAVVTGCSTPAVVGIVGYPLTYVTLTNGVQQWTAGAINVALTNIPNIGLITPAVGCSVAPTNVQVTVEVQAQ